MKYSNHEASFDYSAFLNAQASRRLALKGAVALLPTLAGLTLPTTISAQARKQPRYTFSRGEDHGLEFFNIRPLNTKPELQAVIWADPGSTKKTELDDLDNTPFAPAKKESLSDGYTRYSWTSSNPQRDNVVITDDEFVRSKRMIIGKEVKSDETVVFNRFTRTADPRFSYAPEYYRTAHPGRPYWTRLHPEMEGRSIGFLTEFYTAILQEMQAFPEEI